MNANNSGITPAGHRVLIRPEEVPMQTASGIIVHVPTSLEKEEMAQIYGRIVAIGPECWPDATAPWACVGDRVVFGKYSGLIFPGKDGAKYRIINDRDVVAVINE